LYLISDCSFVHASDVGLQASTPQAELYGIDELAVFTLTTLTTQALASFAGRPGRWFVFFLIHYEPYVCVSMCVSTRVFFAHLQEGAL
jgi:hypothetical protein